MNCVPKLPRDWPNWGLGLLCSVPILLLARRFGFSFTKPASEVAVWIAVGLWGVLGIVTGLRVRIRDLSHPLLENALPFLPAILMTFALLAPGNPAHWGGVLVEFLILALLVSWNHTDGIASAPAGTVAGESNSNRQTCTESESHSGTPIAWTKRFTSDGTETLEGAQVTSFAAGQKEQWLHLVFHPPFSTRPDIVAEDVGLGEVELQVQVAYPFGARILARRASNVDSPATTEIGFQVFERRQSG